MSATTPSLSGVLDGVQVVELAQMVAAPTCGTILMEFGATVVKVEPPLGDIARTMGPLVAPDESAIWRSTNHGKQVYTADIREPEGRSLLLELLAKADVFVTNLNRTFRELYGLDRPSLQRLGLELIYVEVSAFGSGGLPGSDSLIQAATGLMAATGPPGEGGYRAAAPVIDVAGGVWCALGVLAALPELRSHGGGRHLTVSLEDVAVHLQLPLLAVADADGGQLEPSGNASPLAPTVVVGTASRPVAMSILTDKHWHALCTELDVPGLADDARFSTHQNRTMHQAALGQEIGDCFRRDDQETWVQRLQGAGVPCAPVRRYADVLSEVRAWEIGVLERIAVPGGTSSVRARLPLRWTDEPESPQRSRR